MLAYVYVHTSGVKVNC